MVNSFDRPIYDVVIIGGGISSALLAEIAYREGKTALVVSKKDGEMLETIEVNQSIVNYVPIYPPESFLNFSEGYFKNGFIKTTYSSYDFSHSKLPDYDELSYTSYLISRSQHVKYIFSSEKVFGRQVHTRTLCNAGKKVEAHYLQGKPPRRLGFHEGKSAYYTHLKRMKDYSDVINAEVCQIMSNERKLLLSGNSREINYRCLISTIPPYRISTLLGKKVESSRYISAPAYFAIFTTKTAIMENYIAYDTNPNSPIYRAINVSDSVISVQLSIIDTIEVMGVKRFLAKLINIDEFQLDFVTTRFQKIAYPLDIINKNAHAGFIDDLQENSIIPFGRFGEWKYCDIHELDWGGIIERIKRI